MRLAIMPYLDAAALTRVAVQDVLAQGRDLSLLLIDNGSQEEGRELGIQLAIDHPGQILRWRHDPPLPSLSAVWNGALRFAWEAGFSEALVVNNDVEIWSETYAYLAAVREASDALFVSATGVTPEQYRTFLQAGAASPISAPPYPLPGPDFSCYLITRECHERYPFDEGYIPAYCEDLDYHRRLMLGGDGSRIFGTGLPFLHVGSGTLTSMDATARMKWERRISQGSRAHHLEKWGGPANEERYAVPFDPTSAREGVKTQELFARVRVGEAAIVSAEV